MKPHVHAEAIKAWAEGALVQFYDEETDEWRPCLAPSWYPNERYRIKPAEPERKPYPETDLTDAEIKEMTGRLTQRQTPYWDDHREMINEALRKAWGAGQIVTRAEFDRAVGDRQKRDETLAFYISANVLQYMARHFNKVPSNDEVLRFIEVFNKK